MCVNCQNVHICDFSWSNATTRNVITLIITNFILTNALCYSLTKDRTDELLIKVGAGMRRRVEDASCRRRNYVQTGGICQTSISSHLKLRGAEAEFEWDKKRTVGESLQILGIHLFISLCSVSQRFSHPCAFQLASSSLGLEPPCNLLHFVFASLKPILPCFHASSVLIKPLIGSPIFALKPGSVAF